jgi:hypothetical protein
MMGHSSAVRSLIYSKDGNVLYSAGSDGKLFKWNLKAEEKKPSLIFGYPHVMRALALSIDERILYAAGDSPFVQIFDQVAGNIPQQVKVHKTAILDIIADPIKAGFYSAGSDSTVKHFTNNTISVISEKGSRVKTLTVSHDGKLLIGGRENGTVSIWDLTNKNSEKVMTIRGSSSISAVALNSDASLLAFSDTNGKVKVWDIKNNKLLHQFSGHKATVNKLIFHSKAGLLASASFDGTIRIWNLNYSNDQPIIMRDHDAWVWTIAFSPDNKELVAGTTNNQIKVWSIKPELMSEDICSRISRNLTPSEWRTYVGDDIPYQKTCNALPQGVDEKTDESIIAFK